jgi:hypothetical protein
MIGDRIIIEPFQFDDTCALLRGTEQSSPVWGAPLALSCGGQGCDNARAHLSRIEERRRFHGAFYRYVDTALGSEGPWSGVHRSLQCFETLHPNDVHLFIRKRYTSIPLKNF